jgi:DNA polymerase-3 subunit alpha
VSDGLEVRVGGLVSSAGLRMSKKGKPLIIGSLEDVSGSNDFLVFGSAVEQYKELLVEGAKVIIKAKVSFRNDSEEDTNFTLIVNEVKPATDCKPLELKFITPPSYEELVYVGKILALHRGDTPVVLCFNEHTLLKTSPNFWVDAQRTSVLRQQLASHVTLL